MSRRRKDRLRTPIARALLHGVSRLPLGAAHRLGGALGWLASWVPNRDREVTEFNVSLCFPELSETQRQRLARRSMVESGKGVTELPACWLWPGDKFLALVRGVSGQDVVDAARARNKGVIFAIPHLGAWEFLGPYLGYHFQTVGLGKPLKMLDDLVTAARIRLGGHMVPANTTGVRQLLRTLKHGGVVGILPDQVTDTAQGAGVLAPFFGVPADTNVLIPNLALRTGAPVVFAFAERLPRGRGFHLHFRANPPLEGEPTADNMARQINEQIEACVRGLPEQYLWGYKRFRGSPALSPSAPYT